MKIKKLIIIILFPLIAEIVVSCCQCTDSLVLYYTNKTLSISNLDNRGSEPIVSSSPSFIKTAYGIRINLVRENIACIKQTNYFIIQSANATSCRCPPITQFLPRDSITSLKIFALNDFDLNHSANSDISDYFKVYKQYSFASINDYLKNLDSTVYDEQEFDLGIDLLLMTAPTLSSKHKFKVQIILSDGRMLEQETSLTELI